MKRQSTAAAYDFLHRGTLLLSEIMSNGVRVDMDYIDRTVKKMRRRVEKLEAKLKKHKYFKVWQRMFGEKTKITSDDQLSKVLKKLGFTMKAKTKSTMELYDKLMKEGKDREAAAVLEAGRDSVNKDALEDIDIPYTRWYTKAKQLRTTIITKGLLGIKKESIEHKDGLWYVHPSYHFLPATYRSGCLAKGTLIEVVRDISKFPKGIPIEDVRVGDLVYCYDDDLNLTVRPVMWSGKTGHKKVLRLHWTARGKKGHLDLTPNHKVRLASGKYVKARKLKVGQDYRQDGENRHNPKVRTLAMGRVGSRLYETGNKTDILDHRLVYESCVGKLKKKDHVHHKDLNHSNNVPSNLEKLSASEHSLLHGSDAGAVDKRTKKAMKTVRQQKRMGLWVNNVPYKSGEENHNWIHLTKFQALRILSSFGGKASQVARTGFMDFDTFKRKAKLLGIDLKEVKDRYDLRGRYVSRGRLKRACKKGRKCLQKRFGYNFYKANRVAESRGFKIKCLHNHKITKIEYLDKKVDVYDLTVKEFHNYIANEICVHNCEGPNFQNNPVREPWIADIIRSVFVPRVGNHFVENDLAQIEWRIVASYCKDKNMLRYIRDKTTDVHRDVAMEIFLLDEDQVSKNSRYSAKNMMVFPQVYGSVYFQCAEHIWKALKRLPGMGVMKKGDDKNTPSGRSLIDHLRKKGIKELGDCTPGAATRKGTLVHHIKQIEDRFWNERFPEFRDWKRKFYNDYLNTGGFWSKTGIYWSGEFVRNAVTNYVIQGDAFKVMLWAMMELRREIRTEKMKSLLVGEVHDCSLGDVPPEELQQYLDLVKDVVEVRVRKQKMFDWITVPIEIEAEVTPVNGAWSTKKDWIRKEGLWQLKV